MDWREKVVEYEIREDFQIPEGARGLGAIEGNQSNLFSDRMKDLGMSWSVGVWRRADNGRIPDGPSRISVITDD